jgi:hypothetical protein
MVVVSTLPWMRWCLKPLGVTTFVAAMFALVRGKTVWRIQPVYAASAFCAAAGTAACSGAQLAMCRPLGQR